MKVEEIRNKTITKKKQYIYNNQFMNKENCFGLAETILGGLHQFNFLETSPLSSEAAPDIEHKNNKRAMMAL